MNPAALALGVLLGGGLYLLVAPGKIKNRSGGRRSERSRLSWSDRLQDRLRAVGIRRLNLGGFLLLSGGCGLLLGLLTLGLSGVYLFSAIAVAAGGYLPLGYVNWRYHRLQLLGGNLWPDVVDNLVSSIRAGLGLPEALCALAKSGPPPIRSAFTVFVVDYHRSGHFESSLLLLKQRLADAQADRILETLRLARQVGGGDLTRVLGNLADYLRQEAAVRAEVVSRQSWVVNAAKVGVAAPWAVLLFLSTRSETVSAYNSVTGAWIIGIGAAVCLLAYRIMRIIGRLPAEERYFA